MAKRILLPLDRIEDAELALSVVGEAARSGGAQHHLERLQLARHQLTGAVMLIRPAA